MAEVRYHLDEHLNPAIAKALRERRIDVTTTIEAGLLGADDADQLAHAQREGRVIVNGRLRFSSLCRRLDRSCRHCFCRRRTLSLGQTIDRLTLIHGVLSAEEMAGHVEYL